MTQQRETFDEIADTYARVRPELPAPALEALWQHLAVAPGAPVLDVGCGTGLLTRHLAERGARVTALDPGSRLLALCARALEGHDAELVCATFEAWDPGDRRFEALTACQAAHWIEPRAFLDRAAAVLQPGGRLGLVWHLDRSEGSAFWRATQALYDRFLPDADDKPPRTIPHHVDAYERALAADARFAAGPRQAWPWTRTFDEATYLLLLHTHSPVRMLPEEERAAFLDGHRGVIRDLGGRVERRYETVLLPARLA